MYTRVSTFAIPASGGGEKPLVAALNQQGEAGGLVVVNTATVTGDFGCIDCIADTVIATINAPQLSNAAALVGVTLTDGTKIFTNVLSFSLTSGKVIAYRRQ